MKIPYSILKQFVPTLKHSPEQLADIITLKSYEVDSVYNPATSLNNVVVGHIREIQPHPNADKLQIAKVSVGKGESLDIVCGAKNIELGQKVPVARIGATLPNGLNIQPVNLRGQDSFGMLCSAKELGLDFDSEGILILPSSAVEGAPVADVLGLNEAIIDIDNKGLGTRASDSSSFYGVAREVSIITNNKLEDLELSELPLENKLSKKIQVETSLCSYYSILELSGLSSYKFDSNILSKGNYRVDLYVQTDTFKIDSNIHRILRILNQKTHHPAVDLGNYILFETGQPVHIFDAEKLRGNQVIVREAKKGEIFLSLDGVEFILADGDIVICDSEGIIALAGIIGGASASVGDGTTKVLIESANFDSERIRSTARRLKLLTESAKRFERKIPAELADVAIQRTINITQKSGLDILGYTKTGDSTTQNKVVALNYDYARKYIGAEISNNEINDYLKSLSVGVHKMLGANKYKLKAPYWRLDLNTPEEYIEEIARLYGYENIPAVLDLDKLTSKPNTEFDFKRKISEALVDLLYIEVLTYPYTTEGTLKLMNPVDESKPYLRQTLSPSLHQALINNQRNRDVLRLFEVGNVFTAQQNLHISLTYWDKAQSNNKNISQAYIDFLRVLKRIGFDTQLFSLSEINGTTLIYYLEQEVGLFNPQYLALEFDLSVLVSLLKPIQEKFTVIPKYPSVKRDITIGVSKDIGLQSVYSSVKSIVSNRCEYIGFIDRFENEKLVNYTFHLEFRDPEKSLSDEEVNLEIDKIYKKLKSSSLDK